MALFSCCEGSYHQCSACVHPVHGVLLTAGNGGHGARLRCYAGFETADFVYPMEDFPQAVVPDYRRKRSYLSSVLARNEVSRDAPYNRRLFVRIERGHYLPSPAIEVQIGDAWKPIYDFVGIEDLEEDNHFVIPMLKSWVRHYTDTGTLKAWSWPKYFS